MWEVREWETHLPLEECWRRPRGTTEPDVDDAPPGSSSDLELDRVLLKDFGSGFRLRASRSWIRPDFGPCLYGDFVRGSAGIRIVGQFEPSRTAQVMALLLAGFLALGSGFSCLLALAHEVDWIVPAAPLAVLRLGAEAFRRHWSRRFPKRRRLSEFVESVFEATPRESAQESPSCTS